MRNKILTWLVFGGLFCAASAHGAEKFFEIKAKRYSYAPNKIRVNQGDKVRIRLVSTDVRHGFFLDGYELETNARPGEVGNLEFVADKTGRFSFRCSVTCGDFHPYMIGYLYVAPNTKFYGGIAFLLLFGIGSFLLAMRKKHDDPRPKLFGIIPFDWRFELTQFRFVRAILKSRWFPFLPIVGNLLVFIIIMFAAFVGGFGAGNYNFGIMMIWILWFVLLMLFMVPLVGRVWCMVCPFPLFGDWFQRGKLIDVSTRKPRDMGRKWPNGLRNLWPLVILFWLSTWFTGFFTVRPMATFIFIGVIIIAATVVGMFFRGRGFCLAGCPVSGFQGLYANFSLCEVRAKDPEVCKNHKLKTCSVGNENGYGCPWMELPYEMNRNTYCGMCMECFKTCPHDNMAFNIRPFGADLLNDRRKTDDRYSRRGADEAFKALTMIGIMFTFFIIMQGPFGSLKENVRGDTAKGYISYLLESASTDFLLVPLLFLGFAFLSKKVSGNKDVKLRDVFVNFSYCLVPVGLAIWAAFSLGIILPNGSYLLHIFSDPFDWGWDVLGTAHIPWTPVLTWLMPYLQVSLVLAGLLFALDFGYKFSLKTYATLEEAKRGWVPMIVYLLGLHVFFLWVFTA